MKAIIAVSGMVLAATAAAVLLGTSRLAPPPHQRSLRLVPTRRPEAGRVTRRRCVRLGWKAPYWYASA